MAEADMAKASMCVQQAQIVCFDTSHCRTLIQAMKDLVFLPVYLLKTLYLDVIDFLSRWRTFATEYEQKVRESQNKLAESLQKVPEAERPQGAPACWLQAFFFPCTQKLTLQPFL